MSTVRKFFVFYPVTLVAFAAFFSAVGLVAKNDPLVGLTPGTWWTFVLIVPAILTALKI